MEYRRRVPRQRAGWYGSCLIGGESATEWCDCRVIDISVLGLGIQIHHSRPSELVGRRVSVEVPPVGDSVNILLEGEIRNAALSPGGTVRVGIEFIGLSDAERSIVDILTLSHAMQ